MNGHGGHSSWMMLACCVPMVLVAVALVATGAVSAGFLVWAGLCVGAMFLMMRAMDASPHDSADRTEDRLH